MCRNTLEVDPSPFTLNERSKSKYLDTKDIDIGKGRKTMLKINVAIDVYKLMSSISIIYNDGIYVYQNAKSAKKAIKMQSPLMKAVNF